MRLKLESVYAAMVVSIHETLRKSAGEVMMTCVSASYGLSGKLELSTT